jgi:hypothetical protein
VFVSLDRSEMVYSGFELFGKVSHFRGLCASSFTPAFR